MASNFKTQSEQHIGTLINSNIVPWTTNGSSNNSNMFVTGDKSRHSRISVNKSMHVQGHQHGRSLSREPSFEEEHFKARLMNNLSEETSRIILEGLN